jgi:hypothetical protein
MYNLTKGFLTKISVLPRPALAEFMVEKVKEFLDRAGEEKAARWIDRQWTGERGRFTVGHAGYGCPSDNNGEEATWGKMKKLISNSCSYNVFMATCLEWIKNKCRDQEAQDAALSDDSWQLPNQPIFGKDLWRDVRKLTVSELRNWTVRGPLPELWNDMLDTIAQFMEDNQEPSLARAIVTWNSTHETVLLSKADMPEVVYPTRQFLTLLGNGYRYHEGVEAQRQLALYTSIMLRSETEMVRTAHDMHMEVVLNNTQYFHHATVLNSPWAPHAQLCCSCKDCYKNCICVHTLILSLICDKIQIPEHLDERILERAINSKKAAREFAGVCRDKEADRERALIFEVLNFVLMYT